MGGSLSALPLVVAVLLFIRIKLKSTIVAGIMNMWWVIPLAEGTFIEYSIQCLISLIRCIQNHASNYFTTVWTRMYYIFSITWPTSIPIASLHYHNSSPVALDIKVSIRCTLQYLSGSYIFGHTLFTYSFFALCYIIREASEPNSSWFFLFLVV